MYKCKIAKKRLELSNMIEILTIVLYTHNNLQILSFSLIFRKRVHSSNMVFFSKSETFYSSNGNYNNQKKYIHKIRKLVLVSYRYNNRYPGCTTRTSVPSQPTCLNKLVSKKNKNKKSN